MANEKPAETASGWQPIETAPQDGTLILIVDVNAAAPGARIAHWGKFNERFVWRVGEELNWEDPEIGNYIGWFENPTHWMPLPSPPGLTP